MATYGSPILFHGPTAREEAVGLAAKMGRLLRPPIGDEGLKIADSRDIVELLDNSPVGDAPGVIVVGPLCRASHATTDVLLKTLEEFDPARVRPVFWAFSATEVSSTIRSRCLLHWCPGPELIEGTLREVARKLLRANLKGDLPGLIGGLKDTEVVPLLKALAVAVVDHGVASETDQVWSALRTLLRLRDPTALELLAVLLPEAA